MAGHDANAFVAGVQQRTSPAATATAENARDAASAVKYKREATTVADQYRTLTGVADPVIEE